MAFESHIDISLHTYGSSIANVVFDIYAVMWVYVDYSSSAVGHIYAMWQACLFISMYIGTTCEVDIVVYCILAQICKNDVSICSFKIMAV